MSTTTLFLSWCHEDRHLKEAFVRLLTPNLKIVKGHDFSWWEDSLITPGEEWEDEINAHLGESDYVVQLLSPGFLASDFIRDHEIPGIGKTPDKRTLPVMLVNVPLNGSYEFHGINKRQIFLSRRGRPRAFDELSSGAARRQFVTDFTDALVKRLEAGGTR